MHVSKFGPSRLLSRPNECSSIAIDLGGTIEDSWQSKRRWFARKGFDLGPWPRSRGDVIQAIGDQNDLYEEMVAEVYSDDNVLRRAPVKGVASALKTLATQFRLLIVSSRNERQRATTLQWLKYHGLNAFVDDIALLGADRNKLAWCRSAGVQFFVDDDLRHLDASDAGDTLTKVHFLPRPLNAHRTHEGVNVAASWHDIVAIIIALQNPQGPRGTVVRADQ